MRKHGGLQEAGALFSWFCSGFCGSVKHPLLMWRFNFLASNLSTWSTTSRGKLEQAFGLRELHPSFTQHTLVRSVPKTEKKLSHELLIAQHASDVWLRQESDKQTGMTGYLKLSSITQATGPRTLYQNESVAYISSGSLRTRLRWLTIARFKNFYSIFRSCALPFSQQFTAVLMGIYMYV